SPLNRVVRIWGVEDIFQILPTLKPLGPFLQNAAVAVGDKREKAFIENLGDIGLARITSPGQMPLPTMMWHHDGISPLAMLLRWCDVEKKEEIGGIT
ncbi:MAG: acyl-CoA reductase, partial [Deltaproteobacteria bacterium]|nr:acyl-CoA reductase [Deltaproteobacteria bacterium]